MIGHLPNRLRPLGLKRKRTLPYTGRRSTSAGPDLRSRPRKERAHAPRAVDTGRVLFDPPRELPTATVVVEPRTFGELLRGGIALWFSERWRWIRPRTIPMAVALVGLLGVVRAVDYLTHLPAPAHTRSIASPVSELPSYDPTRLRIVVSE
jgi:hypothetical protein